MLAFTQNKGASNTWACANFYTMVLVYTWPLPITLGGCGGEGTPWQTCMLQSNCTMFIVLHRKKCQWFSPWLKKIGFPLNDGTERNSSPFRQP